MEITMGRIGVGMRFVALLIDAVIIFIIRFILLIPFGVRVTFAPNMTAEEILKTAHGAVTRAMLIGGLVGLAYFVTEIVKAASPGKMILKQKIVKMDGTPAPQDALIKRYLLKNSPNIMMFLWGITGIGLFNALTGLAGLFFLVSCLMAFRNTKTALHDDLAGTCVYGPETVPVGFPVGAPSGGAVPPPMSPPPVSPPPAA
jgi:uncharacterized RDD family membrane protein YckC